MTEPRALTKREVAELVLPGTVDDLYRRLLTLPRWRELPGPRFIPDLRAVYLRRDPDGFRAMSLGPAPPGFIPPPWVRVVARPDARGVRLTSKRIPSSGANAATGLSILATALPLGIMALYAARGAVIGVGAVAGYLAFVTVLWFVVIGAWRSAWKSSNLAWDQLSRAVTRLALGEAEDEAGPFRE